MPDSMHPREASSPPYPICEVPVDPACCGGLEMSLDVWRRAFADSIVRFQVVMDRYRVQVDLQRRAPQ